MKLDTLTSSFLGLRGKLHHIAMRFLHSDEDAWDALQDTYLKLKTKGEVKSESEANNKLIAVLRNVCIDRLRKHNPVSIDAFDAINTLSVEPCTDDIAELERLLQVGLSPMQKKIFRLVVHEGMEYEDIAEALNMKIEAVRMNMSRTRRKILETYNKLNK